MVQTGKNKSNSEMPCHTCKFLVSSEKNSGLLIPAKDVQSSLQEFNN